MDERSDGGGAASERCGDVGLGEVDVEPKHQCGLLAPRQPRESVEEFVMLGNRGFGCWRWVSSDHGLMAMNVATSIDDDGAQVRRRVVSTVVRSRLQANERVLHDLLGGRPRAGQQVRDSHERRPLPFVQFSDPCPVAGTPWLSVGSHHTVFDGAGARSVARADHNSCPIVACRERADGSGTRPISLLVETEELRLLSARTVEPVGGNDCVSESDDAAGGDQHVERPAWDTHAGAEPQHGQPGGAAAVQVFVGELVGVREADPILRPPP